MSQVGDLFAAESGGIKVAKDSVGTLAVKLGSANAESKTNMRGSVINNSKSAALNLTVQGNTDFQKEVTVTSMTVNSGKTATMNATLKAGTVTNNGELKFADKATIIGGSMSNVKMSSEGISSTATDGTRGTISNADVQIAQLAADASFSIEDMMLTNTTITAATVKTNVTFDNVTVAGASALKGMQAAMTDAQLQVGMGGSAGTFSATTSMLSGITLKAGEGASLTVDLGDLSSHVPMGPGKYDLSVTLSGFSMDSYTNLADGSGLLIAADSWLGKLLAQSNNANVQISISQVAAGEAAVAGGGAATGVSYSTGNVGTIITINGLNVPEPTTSTLSLLALAGLCARRRRR